MTTLLRRVTIGSGAAAHFEPIDSDDEAEETLCGRSTIEGDVEVASPEADDCSNCIRAFDSAIARDPATFSVLTNPSPCCGAPSLPLYRSASVAVRECDSCGSTFRTDTE